MYSFGNTTPWLFIFGLQFDEGVDKLDELLIVFKLDKDNHK